MRMRSMPLAAGAVVLALAFGTAGTAGAAPPPSPGQPGAPNRTCGPDFPNTPGQAASSPGSPFNADGQAGLVYAGNPGTASLIHANSVHAVSQYDVACIQQST